MASKKKEQSIRGLAERIAKINGGKTHTVTMHRIPNLNLFLTFEVIKSGYSGIVDLLYCFLIAHIITGKQELYETAEKIAKLSPEEISLGGLPHREVFVYPKEIWNKLKCSFLKKEDLEFWILIFIYLKNGDIRVLQAILDTCSDSKSKNTSIKEQIISKSPWPNESWLHIKWNQKGSANITLLSGAKIPALPEFKRQEGEEYLVINQTNTLSHQLPLPEIVDEYRSK